jgi:adenylyltransferase/sulfurtransferase
VASFGIPEMSVGEVARRRGAGEALILLDVRELQEQQLANLGDGVFLVPMSRLIARQLEALPAPAQDKEAEIVIFCHTGQRSGQVTAWLQQKGWKNVYNMAGGIDAWAREVDPSVGFY